MKKLQHIKYVLALIVCFTLMPLSVFASTNTILLNSIADVKQGEQIAISGTTSLKEVIVQVIRPGQTSTLYYDILSVENEAFHTTITIPSDAVVGTYTVVAGKASQVATQTFAVASSGGGGGGFTPPVDGAITPPPGGSDVPGDKGDEENTTPDKSETIIPIDTSKNEVKQSTNSSGQGIVVVSQNAAALETALKNAGSQNTSSVIVISQQTTNKNAGVVFELPAAPLANTASTSSTTIRLQANNVSYDLPVNLIDFATIAKQLGVAVSDLTIKISVTPADNDINTKVQNKAASINTKVSGTVMTFEIEVASSKGATTVSNFNNQYVARTITTSLVGNPNNATVVTFNPTNNSFSFVPATFTSQGNDNYSVSFKRPGNSIYAVIEGNKNFEDISTHWAKSDIELLANKLIISGITDTKFEPTANITRAQFSALLVRALGLNVDDKATSFSDVKTSDWFAGEVVAAVNAGIVTGVTANTFNPNDVITREQMAVMIGRVLSFVGDDVANSTDDSKLSLFKDSSSISSWAKASVSQVVNAQIINGYTADTFAPSEKATRAQATVMLKRLLEHISFIN